MCVILRLLKQSASQPGLSSKRSSAREKRTGFGEKSGFRGNDNQCGAAELAAAVLPTGVRDGKQGRIPGARGCLTQLALGPLQQGSLRAFSQATSVFFGHDTAETLSTSVSPSVSQL